MRRFENSEFRIGKLYKEAIDYILRKHLQTLKDVYRKASSIDTLPNEDTVMSMAEFVDLIQCSEVVDENFGARDAGTLFNLSIMTQVDEIHSERHLQMHFIEFIEALARVADRAITYVKPEILDPIPVATDLKPAGPPIPPPMQAVIVNLDSSLSSNEEEKDNRR